MKLNLIPCSIRRALTVGMASLGASIAQAHPGHGMFDHGAGHVFTSPDHLLVLAAGGIALFGAAFLIRRSRPRRALQLAGAWMAAGALIVWSFA